MANLGSLYYTLGLKDLTDADLQKINKRLENLGATVKVTPEMIKSLKDVIPKGIKIELDPELKKLSNEALERAAEGKAMKVAVTPLLTGFREAIIKATKENPPLLEVGVQEAKLRSLITSVLNKQGFMLNVSTVNDNYSRTIQQKLDGHTFTIRIHADAREIAQNLEKSLTHLQSRSFGLQVSKDVLTNSINEALSGQKFPISVVVDQSQMRKAVQDVLNQVSKSTGSNATIPKVDKATASVNKLTSAHRDASSAASTHASASVNLGSALGRNIKIAGELGTAMGTLYSVHAAKQFLSQVIEIGGELEHQKIALETIYGTPSKMEGLYGQIKSLARQSPFGVMELTKNVKQLSAYGVAYNEVYDTAKRLADISAATSVDIQRLILAFGKTKNRTFLDGLEAKQFAYANIPIYDMLSKKLTELEGKFVSVKDVMGRIKKREIGFDMVKDILWEMTDEGGKFYNMQEKLAGSVKTSWKLVRDNIELMFGEIAESSVGDFLKSIGQTLQQLTRDWRALAGVIAVGGIAFGVYKLAVMGINTLLEKQTTDIVASHLAEKKAQAARLKSIGLSGRLSASEKELIATRNRLTAADLKKLQSEQALTSHQIKRLYLSGKISRAQLQEAVTLGVIGKRQFEVIAGTSIYNNALIRLGATAKATWASIKSGISSASGLIFNWTTAAFAAIAGVTYLISHNQEENKRADEFSKTWKQTGEDVAKELTETLKKPFENLSAPQADQLIEEYKNKIRDFAALPEDIISKAIYDKDGKILDTTNQIKNLRKELETLQQTAEGMNLNLGSVINATGDGWFKEDVITNLKDYSDAYNKANSIYLKFVNDHKETAREMVVAASNASPAFEKEIANAKNLTEQFSTLMRERTKFPEAWKAAEGKVGKMATRGGNLLGSFSFLVGKTTPFEASLSEMRKYKQAMADIKAAIEGFKNTHENKDWDWDNLTEAQSEEVRQFYKEIIKTAELSAPELIGTISSIFENAFGVDMVSGEEVRQKIVGALNKGMEAEVGKAVFEKIKNGLELTDEEKSAVLAAFDKIYSELYEKVPDVQKEALEKASKQQTASGLVWSEAKEMQIVASLNVRANWEQWQREIDDTAGNIPEIQTWVKGASDIPSFIKAVQEGYKAAKSTMDQLKPLVMKAGIEFNFGDEIYTGGGSLYQGMSQMQQKIIDEYNEAVKIVKAAKKAGDSMSFDPAETKKSSSSSDGKPHRDMLASKFKAEFADLRDGWAEVQKLADSLGFDAAMKKVENSPLFGNYQWGEGPKSLEDYRREIFNLRQKLYESGIAGHPERETLFNDMTKKLFEIDRTLLERNIQSALDTVSQEVERQTADWNLFDKIRKATGNQDLAVSIAFGLNSDVVTDYPAMVKKKFDQIAKAYKEAAPKAAVFSFDDVTEENLSKMPKELQKAYKEARSDLEKYAREQKEAIADILNEYQSLSDKLAKIDADRERKIKTVRESDMSDADKAKYIQRINVEADYQKFTQSNEYLQFFGGIYALTMSQAQQIGDLIEENLNRKLQAGAISAEDYYKEIERVRQQLDKLRNVKSNALTFMTEGFKGLNKKEWEKNEAERLKASQKVEKLETNLAEVKANGNMYEIQSAEAQLEAAKKELAVQNAIRKKLVENQQWMENTLGVVNVIANIAGGMSDAFNTLRDMANSFGFDTDSNAWNTAASVMDTLTTVTGGVQKTLQSLMSGDIGGVISGVFDTLLSPITIWNKLHDKKLDKMIEKSKEAAQIMQNQYDILEKQMANFLGNAALMRTGALGGGYGKQRELMQGQLAELQKQRQAEIDKKKTDDSVVRDYEQQIAEMQIAIRDFALEAAKDLYGIDLNSWAEQLGDALVDAFAAGEDAAEAFDKTVSDIMRDVTSKMISQDILAPMFGDLRDYLFGKDGTGGAFGSDFQLDPSEMGAMKEYLDKIKNEGIPAAQELFDAINEATGGILNDTEKSKSGMTKGLQSLTENTGDLLASYLNAVRGDTSAIRLNWDKLMESTLPQMNVIAEAQLTAQRQIAENTLRNAIAAEAIQSSAELMAKYSKSIDDRLRRAQADKSMGFYLR